MNSLVKMLRGLVSGLAELSPSCRTAVRLQSEALDHKLTRRQRLGLRFHLALCKWCSRYGKQIAFVRDVAPSHPEEATAAVSTRLPDEARERMQQNLRKHLK